MATAITFGQAPNSTFGQAPNSREQDQNPRSLRTRVAKARAANTRAVDLGASEGVPPIVMSLKEALHSYSLFVVVPVTEETVVENDRHILTWYKLRIIERLSTAGPSPMAQDLTDFPGDILPKMQPAGTDEVLLLRNAGQVTIDGITFSERLVNFPPLNTGSTYVCVLDVSKDGRVATAPLSGIGIYELTQREMLKPLSRPV